MQFCPLEECECHRLMLVTPGTILSGAPGDHWAPPRPPWSGDPAGADNAHRDGPPRELHCVTHTLMVCLINWLLWQFYPSLWASLGTRGPSACDGGWRLHWSRFSAVSETRPGHNVDWHGLRSLNLSGFNTEQDYNIRRVTQRVNLINEARWRSIVECWHFHSNFSLDWNAEWDQTWEILPSCPY